MEAKQEKTVTLVIAGVRVACSDTVLPAADNERRFALRHLDAVSGGVGGGASDDAESSLHTLCDISLRRHTMASTMLSCVEQHDGRHGYSACRSRVERRNSEPEEVVLAPEDLGSDHFALTMCGS